MHRLLIKFSLASLIFGSCIQPDMSSLFEPVNKLEENFDSNSLGWIEENTEYHHLELIDGKYYIECKDSINRQSSANSQKDDYLDYLNSDFEIYLEFEYVEGKKETSGFGLILAGASLDYRFELNQTGRVEVLESVWQNDYSSIIVSDTTTFKQIEPRSKHNFYLVVDGVSFKFYVNSNLIVEDDFRVKNWRDLRLFSNSQTAVNIDYLRIR